LLPRGPQVHVAGAFAEAFVSDAEVISETGRRYLRLQRAAEVGPIRLGRLLAYFGNVEAVLEASKMDLLRVEGIGPVTAAAVRQARDDAGVEKEIERAAACGVRILCLEDAEYPATLRRVPDPPICLYVRGALEPADTVAIAVVGSRRCSHYGCEQAERFGALLGQAGFTVVSGLARGIDGHAHRGALRSGGRTLGVLGNGLANVYPPEHFALATEITQHGALLSELPLDTGPEAKNFPPRNRIIVGLALGVLVVEAGEHSGALISARLANEYNREVFALPGRVDQLATSSGTNALIRDGHAKLVMSLEDILAELGPIGDALRGNVTTAGDGDGRGTAPASAPGRLSEPEQLVLNALDIDPLDIDTVCRQVTLPPARVAAVLTTLQLKGVIQQLPGHRFVRRRASGPAVAVGSEGPSGPEPQG